jgi:hypothetical protein
VVGELTTDQEAVLRAVAPRRQFGDFRIIREVGHGGMGLVYAVPLASRHDTVSLIQALRSRDPFFPIRSPTDSGGTAMNQGIDAARHLLLGLLALQTGLIDQVALVAAFHAWTQDKARPLPDHSAGLGCLDAAHRPRWRAERPPTLPATATTPRRAWPPSPPAARMFSRKSWRGGNRS